MPGDVAREPAQATPQKLRESEVFTREVERRMRSTGKSNEGNAQPPEDAADDPADSRQANDREPKDAGDDVDLSALPPEVQEHLKRKEKSFQADYTKKTQQLAKMRKELESKLKEHDEWAPARERWNKADHSRRQRIIAAFEDDQGDKHKEPEADEMDEFSKFIESLEESGRPVARTMVEMAAKLSRREATELIKKLSDRLDRLEGNVTARDQDEGRRYAASEYERFVKQVPDYEQMDPEFKEAFEDSFEHAVQKDPRGTNLVEHYKRFVQIVDRQASRKSKDRISELASRAEEAPLQPSGASGSSRLPSFKDDRQRFNYFARKFNIRT